MTNDVIEQFMWEYQQHFAGYVEIAAVELLKEIGCHCEVEVVLVGFAEDESQPHPICIEPEKRSYFPSDFAGVEVEATRMYGEHPRSRMAYGDAVGAKRLRELRDRMRAQAVKDVLEDRHPTGRETFFVSDSARVNGYDVHVAIGVPSAIVDAVPRLHTGAVGSGITQNPIPSSLLAAALDEMLKDTVVSLDLPDPGMDTPGNFPRTAEDKLREAARKLLMSAVSLTGTVGGWQFFRALNKVSTMLYEKRTGFGRMVLAAESDERVEVAFTFQQPVILSDHRTLRKLLEMSGSDGLSLLTNGNQVYGLGSFRQGDDASETAFEITIEGEGNWDVKVNSTSLMHVEHGLPCLPQVPLSQGEFTDLVTRVLGEKCNAEALWKLAQTAAAAEHGTMLVASAGAEEEAVRLSGQSIVINPTLLEVQAIKGVTSIDGAVLVDPEGAVRAIGVILDGIATAAGDRARGARYNSALRYLDSVHFDTVIVLVSEDGMINLLPKLRRRISRQLLVDLISDLRSCAPASDGTFDRRQFNQAYERVRDLHFYLSKEQCDEVNQLRKQADEIPGFEIRVVYSDLTPDPDMSEEYFLPE